MKLVDERCIQHEQEDAYNAWSIYVYLRDYKQFLDLSSQ